MAIQGVRATRKKKKAAVELTNILPPMEQTKKAEVSRLTKRDLRRKKNSKIRPQKKKKKTIKLAMMKGVEELTERNTQFIKK